MFCCFVTEWRDKLKRILDDDEDEEEFLDETSEEENEDGKSLEVDFEDDMQDHSEDDDSDLLHESDDELTKGSLSDGRLSSSSSVSKTSHGVPLVIDNGSYIVRGGWGGEYSPTACVRNVIGSWRAEASEAWQEALGSKFIGQTAIEKHSTLALDYPIEGIVPVYNCWYFVIILF